MGRLVFWPNQLDAVIPLPHSFINLPKKTQTGKSMYSLWSLVPSGIRPFLPQCNVALTMLH